MSVDSKISLEYFKKTMDKKIEKKVAKILKQEYFDKPYLKMTLVNDVLTIILNDGNIISKNGATPEMFKEVKSCKTEDDLFLLISDESVLSEKRAQKAEKEKIININKGVKIFKNCDEFIVKDKVVYFKETSRSIPPLLLEKFIEVIGRCNNEKKDFRKDEEYLSLKRFFMWCCLNPRAEVARELYRFLSENSFRITKQGFFVALRNVVTVESAGDNSLVQFISNAYNKVKAVWKKNPGHYFVKANDSNQFELVKDSQITNDGTILGRLTDLYLDLPNMRENRFTDHWTRTFDIRVGRVVGMPMEECNWSTQDCMASGLHFTADQINYVGCGDTSMLVLINPMKVVGIGTHKGRCYEYLPIMTVPREEATSILHDISFDTLELDDAYALNELQSLEEKTQAGFVAETTKHEFKLPEISTIEIKNMAKSLGSMKKEISNRIKNIQ